MNTMTTTYEPLRVAFSSFAQWNVAGLSSLSIVHPFFSATVSFLNLI